MTLITPTLPTENERPLVRLGQYSLTGAMQLDVGPCMAIGCNQHVFVAEVTVDHLLDIAATITSEDVSIRDYPFHYGCAARLLGDMFDHFVRSTSGCPFCGAEWSTPNERDGSVWIKHRDHCLYEAIMDELTVLDDEDLLPR